MSITVLIAGLNRGPRRGTLAIVESLAGRSTCAIELDDPLGGDAAPRVGEEVLIAADGDRIFAGSIETVDVTLRAGSQSRAWAITCIDYHRILDRRLAGQKVYNAMRSDLIIGDICINSLQGEGVDFTFVQQGPVLEEFKTDFETAAEAIDRAVKLAKQFWTIDYFKNLRVFSPETYNCPFEKSRAGARNLAFA